MPHKYCKSCGTKNQYVGSIPKFCSNCGDPMSDSSVAKRVFKKSTTQESKAEVLKEDETDVHYVPNIAKLQYQVDPFEKKSFKMEELFDLKDNGKKEKR